MTTRAIRFLSLTLFCLASAIASAHAQSVAENDVTWTALGYNENDSMPIGNGDLAANVWTEQNGDLVLLVSKSDAWSELNKLLKLGGKAAIVIGNNHYKLSEDEELEVRNDQVIFELAQRKDVGFVPDEFTKGLIQRPLEKTQSGYIRNETVVVLEKAKEAAASAA